jgi:putative Holliday junction resolvase|tara:strand:- start:71 stop:493 length:423 start_codon:yes stop_codon:yes gene_type:complete
MGYLVGIDFGTKRTGLALTDPNKIIASGLKNLPTHEVISYLKVLCKTDNIECFVIGRPLQKDGSKSDVEIHIRAFIKSLKKNFPHHQIERHDERFTSKIAFKTMVDAGLKKKKRSNKGLIDQISATLILQSYLDYKKNIL